MSPTAAILETSTAIIGTSGAGKTFTARAMVESLLQMERHTCIIDPTGVWSGLRTNAAGDGPGFSIPIFGGLHGDAPIAARDGATVAKLITGCERVDLPPNAGGHCYTEFRKPDGTVHAVVLTALLVEEKKP
jgi:hypothetical protein